MSAITRRDVMFAGIGATSAVTGSALAVASHHAAADDEWSRLRAFLENASPTELMNYHLMRAADAMNELSPGAWSVRHGLDYGFMMIVDYDFCRRQREEAEAVS